MIKVIDMTNEEIMEEYEKLLEYNNGGKEKLTTREEELFVELCNRLVKEEI